MNSPRTMWLKAFALLAVASAALTSCAVNSDGPAAAGATHGSLGSTNMSDYYYRKDAGYVYSFQNVEHIYKSTGTVTLTGANDVVTTLGYQGIAPNGDSLFGIKIDYRVLTQYAGRPEIDVRYVCNGNSQNGAFIDGSNTVTGEVVMGKRPRPVSTDTIVAGVIGRIRTMCDDFTNTGTYTFQSDTLYFTSHNDSTFIWERFPGATTLSQSRLLFCRDFVNNTSWYYDQINLTSHQTIFKVKDPDMSLTTPAGTFAHTVMINVLTPDVSDNMPTTETKYFACGTGFVKEFDEWYVTTDGSDRTKEDYTHTLISVTHP